MAYIYQSAMDYLTLYRGDLDKITKFDYSKTNKRGLVGQGIYLTSDPNVASTYRTKTMKYGFVQSNEIVLVQKKEAKTKNIAIEDVLKEYIIKVLKKRPEDLTLDIRRQFEDLVSVGQIDIKIRREVRGAVNYSAFYYRDASSSTGHISVFKFPRRLFNDGMFNISDRISSDIQLWEHLWEEGCFKALPMTFTEIRRTGRRVVGGLNGRMMYKYEEEEHQVSINSFQQFIDKFDFDSSILMQDQLIKFTRLRSVLEDLGYLGIEYEGGYITAGIKHRAFCVWDSDFVNEHKVMRTNQTFGLKSL